MARQREAERKGDASLDRSGTREHILAAAEALLRRYGPSKMTVSDVARSLGMSHANVYRHFESKVALQEAVAERWLERISAPLARIAAGTGSGAPKLSKWVKALVQAKRRKVLDEPEMFATYHALTNGVTTVIDRHLEELRRQLRSILTQGIQEGSFSIHDVEAAAQLVLNSTVRFHHPSLLLYESAPLTQSQKELNQSLAVLTAGLRAGVI